MCDFLGNYHNILCDYINREVIETLGVETSAKNYLVDEDLARPAKKWQEAAWPDLPPLSWPMNQVTKSAFAENITHDWTDPLRTSDGTGIAAGLPICVVSADRKLMPVPIPKALAGLIPRGVGNKEIAEPSPFLEAARGVARAINRIAELNGWKVERIAIDAPAAAPTTGPRASEIELGRHGLSSFQTPAASAWPDITEKCVNHLRLGGTAATLPYANKIWMLFGFQLFTCLRSGLRAEVIEVYPFAIIRALLPACEHKSTERATETNSLRSLPAQDGNPRI